MVMPFVLELSMTTMEEEDQQALDIIADNRQKYYR